MIVSDKTDYVTSDEKIAVLRFANAELKAENEKLVKEINELKKKRTKGEINEAYAKTIEADKDEISKLKVKINKLEQKLAMQSKT